MVLTLNLRSFERNAVGEDEWQGIDCLINIAIVAIHPCVVL